MDTIHPMYFQHRLVKYHVDIEVRTLETEEPRKFKECVTCPVGKKQTVGFSCNICPEVATCVNCEAGQYQEYSNVKLLKAYLDRC